MQKITKKLLKEFGLSGGKQHLQGNKEWITNGHFMIRRDKIKMTPQVASWFDAATFSQKHVDLMINASKDAIKEIEYIETETKIETEIATDITDDNVTETTILLSVFQSKSKRMKLKFFQGYIDMAEVKLLKGTKDTSAWFAFDEEGKMWFAVMARRY